MHYWLWFVSEVNQHLYAQLISVHIHRTNEEAATTAIKLFFHSGLKHTEETHRPLKRPMSDMEFHNYLDSAGYMVRPSEFRLSIYQGGIESSLRRVAWRHLLNIFPENMSGRERFDYLKRKEQVFLLLVLSSCVSFCCLSALFLSLSVSVFFSIPLSYFSWVLVSFSVYVFLFHCFLIFACFLMTWDPQQELSPMYFGLRKAVCCTELYRMYVYWIYFKDIVTFICLSLSSSLHVLMCVSLFFSNTQPEL